MSELVNAAVRRSFAEDDADLAAFGVRAKEPDLDFEVALKNLQRRGKR